MQSYIPDSSSFSDTVLLKNWVETVKTEFVNSVVAYQIGVAFDSEDQILFTLDWANVLQQDSCRLKPHLFYLSGVISHLRSEPVT